MCMLCSDMPSSEKEAKERTIKKFNSLFLKPCEGEKDYYRFRLLCFSPATGYDRKTWMIERYIHTHWGEATSKDGNTYKTIDAFVTCPSTKHVNPKDNETLGFKDAMQKAFTANKFSWDKVCPICKHAQSLAPWNNKGHNNKMLSQKFNQLKAQYQCALPVYVVNDPNNSANNGQFKILILTDKKDHDKLLEVVNNEKAKIKMDNNSYSIFNGGMGVDLYMRMEKVSEIRNKGKMNEYTAEVRKITKIVFGGTKYEIVDENCSQIITKEPIDSMDFDKQFYTKSSMDEINEFYNKYYSSSVNVPNEDIGAIVATNNEVKKTETVSTANSSYSNKSEINTTSEMLDSLVDDTENIPAPTVKNDSPIAVEDSNDEVNIDDILNSI